MMAKCIKLRRTKTQVCTGSLNKLIEIYERDIEAPLNSLSVDPDYTELFTLIHTVWAMIETPKGKVLFDDVGTEKIITHVFHIRYLNNITSQNWIIYDNERYDIQNVIDLESNKLYLRLECVLRGTVAKEATEA